MQTKRNHEGVILIDHRESPGIAPELIQRIGLPIGAGRGLFESPTFTCNHCNHIVIMNAARTRSRGYCGKCDHYICDQCEVKRVKTGICYTYEAFQDDVMEKTLKDEVKGVKLL